MSREFKELCGALKDSLKDVNFKVKDIDENECVWCNRRFCSDVNFDHMAHCMNKYFNRFDHNIVDKTKNKNKNKNS